MKQLFLFLLISVSLYAQNETIRRIEFNDSLNSLKQGKLNTIHLPITTFWDGMIFQYQPGGYETPVFYTYGLHNLWLGAGAGNFSITPSVAQNNIGIGENAMYSLLNGHDNLSIGVQSMLNISDGYANVALGGQAGKFVSTAYENVFVGVMAGLNTIDSHQSVYVGTSAGQAGIGAWGNTAVGWNAFRLNTFGKENTSIGISSMFDDTSGNYNTAIGGGALEHMQLGIGNTSLGFRSNIYFNTGHENITIGHYSNYWNDYTTFKHDSSIIIGVYSSLQSDTNKSNVFFLGNNHNPLLYGSLLYNNLKLGVGTSTLSTTLNVGGDASIFGYVSGTQYYFGGYDNTYPMLKRSSTSVEIRLANDGAYAPLTSSIIHATQGLQVGTPSGTGAPSSMILDSMQVISDSLFFYVGGNKYKAVKSEFPYWILLGLPLFFLRRRKI